MAKRNQDETYIVIAMIAGVGAGALVSAAVATGQCGSETAGPVARTGTSTFAGLFAGGLTAIATAMFMAPE